jgi:hypothetical protein
VTYTWDTENHLTKVELPANVVNTVTLDGDGKRRSVEDSDCLRNLLWDLDNILAETDSNNGTVAAYTLAPETYGELVSQRRSGGTSFHHFDALGSTNKLTGADEATIIEYLYHAFGQQTVISGSSANRFTWRAGFGYYHQRDTGEYWVGGMITNPRTGTWLTRPRRRAGRGPAASILGSAHCDPMELGDAPEGEVVVKNWDDTCCRPCTWLHEQIHVGQLTEECHRFHRCLYHWGTTPDMKEMCLGAHNAWLVKGEATRECQAHQVSRACAIAIAIGACWMGLCECCKTATVRAYLEDQKVAEHCPGAAPALPPLPFAEDGVPINQ